MLILRKPSTEPRSKYGLLCPQEDIQKLPLIDEYEDNEREMGHFFFGLPDLHLADIEECFVEDLM